MLTGTEYLFSVWKPKKVFEWVSEPDCVPQELRSLFEGLERQVRNIHYFVTVEIVLNTCYHITACHQEFLKLSRGLEFQIPNHLLLSRLQNGVEEGLLNHH